MRQKDKEVEAVPEAILDHRNFQEQHRTKWNHDGYFHYNFIIDPDLSINSGQVFLWDKSDSHTWYGINGSFVIKVEKHDKTNSNSQACFFPFSPSITCFDKDCNIQYCSCCNVTGNSTTPTQSSAHQFNPLHIFRQDDNLDQILDDIVSRAQKQNHSIIRQAVDTFAGLRLMRQDPFQCCISFICSSNSAIPNIRNMLKRLCARFGTRVSLDGLEFFTFPEPDTLARADISELRSCGLGYRAKAVKFASQMVASGELDLEYLKSNPSYHDTRDALKRVYGIGNKVADCIMLFSLEKLDSFPVDRWTQRILLKYFPEQFSDLFGKSGLLTEKRYRDVHDKAVEIFGRYAGYVQQFLFKMERDLYNKKW